MKQANQDRGSILFINHEESRTGAPRILLELVREFARADRCVCLSLKPGPLAADFKEAAHEHFYPHAVAKRFSLGKRFEAAYALRAPLGLKKALRLGIQMYVAPGFTRRLLTALDPKLVYVNSLMNVQYAWSAKSSGWPTVLHVHELIKAFQGFPGSIQKRIRDAADLFIACSRPVKRVLVDVYGCSEARVALAHEFVSSDEVVSRARESSTEDVCRELGIGRCDRLVMMAGSAATRKEQHRKGLDLFRGAQTTVARRFDGKVVFAWIGRPPRYLARRSPSPRSASGYRDLNYIGEKANPFPYIAAADIFVLSSREDPFPLVMLEAMALGKPVVAFRDSGGAAEALQDGAGVLVEEMTAEALGAAVAGLMADNIAVAEVGRRGRLRQNALYDRSTILPRIRSLVEPLLNE